MLPHLSRRLLQFNNGVSHRWLSRTGAKRSKEEKLDDEEVRDLVDAKPKEIIQKEFPEYFSDGKFASRIGYVDFIDEALDKLDALGLNRNLEAYKEILRVFPPGRYCPKSSWDIGMFHAPQQIAAVRVIQKMEFNRVRPDKEVEEIVTAAFSRHSDVWKKIARVNYWSSKSRNFDPHPLPEEVPKELHQVAKHALMRMLDDESSVITVTSTASLPDVVDRTWIVFAQSSTQKAIISRLDKKSILYLEETGTTYVNDKYLSYFTLRVYDDEETIKQRAIIPEKDYNFNTLKMGFYGKPLKEKLKEFEEVHHIDNSYILATGFTGTSSPDSALSWLKILQRRNPNLRNLNVIFRLKRPTNDLTVVDTNLNSYTNTHKN